MMDGMTRRNLIVAGTLVGLLCSLSPVSAETGELVLVAGATGRTGRLVVTELQEQGYEVRALAALQSCESLSINTVDELALVEDEMRKMGY